MKKATILFMLMALVAARPLLTAGVYSITPTTVQPGQDFEVELSIENLGSSEAEEVSSELETTGAFELKPQSDVTQSLSSLSPGDTFRPKYYLIASSALSSGTYKMEARVCHSGSCITKDVPVTVRGVPRWGISTTSMEEVRAGESLDISLSLKNYGTGTSDNVKIEVVGDENNVIVPVGKTTYFFDQVSAGEEVELDLELFVGTPSKSGSYAVGLTVTYDNETGSRSQETLYYWISVEASGEAIKVTDYTLPESIAPGNVLSAELTLKNTASSSIKNVIMTVPDTDVFTPVGLARIYVGDLAPGDEKEVDFQVAVEGDTEPNTYPLSLAFDYANAQKEAQTAVSETLGLKIVSEPSISVSLRESEPPVLIPGKTSTATLELANTGSASVYYLVVEPVNGYAVSPQSVYIGNLNPDDYDSVDFEITPPRDAEESEQFSLKLTYRDSYNEQVSEKKDIALRTVSPQEGKTYVDSGTSLTTLGAILAVLVIAAWYVRKKKRGE